MAKVSDSALSTFNEWKLNASGKCNFLIFRLDGNGEIAITKKDASGASWTDFCSTEFPDDAACWALYNFGYTTKSGGKRSKTTLIQWIPSKANLKDKMQYAMWSNNVKTALVGIHCIVQAGTAADLEYESVLERVARFERDEI